MPNNKEEFQEKFLSRLADMSYISRERLNTIVCVYGFEYVRNNTLLVYYDGYRHFGSDLLRAYSDNPARAKSRAFSDKEYRSTFD